VSGRSSWEECVLPRRRLCAISQPKPSPKTQGGPGIGRLARLTLGPSVWPLDALHYMALTQFRIHSGASTSRADARGQVVREAIRCLKRHLANVVFRKMLSDARRLDLAA
jgi:hypothetical protein